MALHHRKFLLDEPDKKYPSSCYICHVCPEDCYLSSPPPISESPEPNNQQMSLILIPMLCILGTALLFLSYLTIGKYRSRRGNTESMEAADFVDENHGPVLDYPIWHIRTVGLPQSTIDSISTFRYGKGEGLIETSDCSVCLSEFQEDESLRLLPKCSHAFHVDCIDTWLGSHVNCPVCRAPVLIDLSNVGVLSLVESGSIDSVITEENQESELESQREVRGADETGTENQLADILSENGYFKNKKFRVVSDLSDHRVKLDRESECGGVRRSVSMDFSRALNGLCIKKDEGCSDNNKAVVEKRCSDMMSNSRIFRLIKSTSLGRSLKKGPVLMKRSFSFGGKRSLRKNKRSLEAISIQELSIHDQTG